MKKLTLLIVTAILSFLSCEKDKSIKQQSSFNIGEKTYLSYVTNLYQTENGQLLNLKGEDFDLVIILSDDDGITFEITDTLLASDKGKARCVIQIGNSYSFSNSGFVEFDSKTMTGQFTIQMDDNELKNGIIEVTSTFNEPIIDFKTISISDENGYMLTRDENDWNIRTEWELVERLIFNLKDETIFTDEISFIAYPNPFEGLYQLRLNSVQDFLIDVYYVNSNFEIEQIGKGLHYSQYNMFFAENKYSENFYRLYYKVNINSEFYFGSGDLHVK